MTPRQALAALLALFLAAPSPAAAQAAASAARGVRLARVSVSAPLSARAGSAAASPLARAARAPVLVLAARGLPPILPAAAPLPRTASSGEGAAVLAAKGSPDGERPSSAAKAEGKRPLWDIAGRLADARKGRRAEETLSAELGKIFDAAAAAARGRPEPGRVERTLLPAVRHALDKAEARGVDRAELARAVLEKHAAVFGKLAPAGLSRSLRRTGEWTEFVSAVSLEAVATLDRTGLADDRELLRRAAADENLDLPVPAWHPSAARRATIAGLIDGDLGAPAAEAAKGSVRFRLFGIPIHLTPGFWKMSLALALIFGLADPALGAALSAGLGFSTLVHELSHALAARAFGLRTEKLELNMLGGGAYVQKLPRAPLPEAAIAAAGPLSNLLLAAAAAGAAFALAHLGMPLPPGGFADQFLGQFVFLNISVALFNLVPILPTDGGRIFRAGLTALLGSHARGTRLAGLLGQALALAGILAGAWLTWAFWGGELGWTGVSLLLTAAFLAYFARGTQLHPGTVTAGEAAWLAARAARRARR